MFTGKKLGFVASLAFTFGFLCSSPHASGQQAKDADEDQPTERGLGTSAQDLLALVQKGPAGDGKLPPVEKLDRSLQGHRFDKSYPAVGAPTGRGAPPVSLRFPTTIPAYGKRVASCSVENLQLRSKEQYIVGYDNQP
jgi:hypothetical protein